ncbi:MAG: 2-hydroxyhepta-2,4-diene-1,7-dioate isomerase, partial [Gammaproteobacteria bacterium]|nr:2-hydroxyhepta-2,4-diene-1,7-dioate isomerase [Gammaproteobacteria bacterium]
MKRAQVNIDNRIQQVVVNDDYSVIDANGRTWQEDEITWLPPQHGTVFALGLNYVDHAAELAFKAP